MKKISIACFYHAVGRYFTELLLASVHRESKHNAEHLRKSKKAALAFGAKVIVDLTPLTDLQRTRELQAWFSGEKKSLIYLPMPMGYRDFLAVLECVKQLDPENDVKNLQAGISYFSIYQNFRECARRKGASNPKRRR